MTEDDAALGFSVFTGIGSKSFQRLLKVYGSAELAWNESLQEKFKEAGIGKVVFERFENFQKNFNHLVYREKLQKAKVTFVYINGKDYPESLKKLTDPPIGLFIKGNKELLKKCHSELGSESLVRPRIKSGVTGIIAVVGARKITSYGQQVTESLVRDLCLSNFIIVSGMALGVDGIAHKTTIENKGLTIAVLGCGVDCPYPRENERLYEEILDNNGLIISEYPLGMLANKGTFPARNRIIAGLSSAVLITEAAEGSGSLITADYALKQGKTLFAVPGSITSQMSKGSLKLIKEGAVMVSSVDDILEELKVKIQNSKGKSESQNLKVLKLKKDEKKVYEVLMDEERTMDEIAKLTGLKLSKLSIILSEMELLGIIKITNGKFLIK